MRETENHDKDDAGNVVETDPESDPDIADRQRRMREAVRDLPDVEPRKLTKEDVKTLRDAGLNEVAEVAEIYVSI